MLKDKKCLITGAVGDIGMAICDLLLKNNEGNKKNSITTNSERKININKHKDIKLHNTEIKGKSENAGKQNIISDNKVANIQQF